MRDVPRLRSCAHLTATSKNRRENTSRNLEWDTERRANTWCIFMFACYVGAPEELGGRFTNLPVPFAKISDRDICAQEKWTFPGPAQMRLQKCRPTGKKA